MTQVSISKLTKVYPGESEPALDGLSLEIESGTLAALLGPSGCGKTTTMKMIAGLLAPTSGDVFFDGRSIIADKPEHRGVVMVFQNYLLFPYMSVADNIGFGLKMRRMEKSEIARRVEEMLELVKLPGFGARRPSELSGGQQQRVALARALVVRPNVLLLDEPLSNLDAHLRFEMRDLIQSLQRDIGITTIFVTHDQEEAVVLADKVALILDGRLKQYDDAEMFYKRPVDEATARFFGGTNFIEGESDGRTFQSVIGTLELQDIIPAGRGKLTFRPENVRIGDPGAGPNAFETRLVAKHYLGTHTRLKLEIGGIGIEAVSNPSDVAGYAPGDRVTVNLSPASLWVLPA